MSAATTSAPSLAKSFALAPFTSLVSTRAAKPPFGSLRTARTKPPPWAPVAPTTAITFLSLIVTSFSSSRRLHRGYVSYDDTISKSRQRSGVASISLASGRNFRHFSLGDVGRVRNSVLGLCSHNGHRRRLR